MKSLLLRLVGLFLLNAALGAADTRHLEFRIYEPVPGNLEAILERFRDHIGTLRARHGIQTLGYWTGTNAAGGEVFVYLIAATNSAALRASETAFGADPEFQKVWDEAMKKYGNTVAKITRYPLKAVPWMPVLEPQVMNPPRAFELRIYDVAPEKYAAYVATFRDTRAKLFERHGFTNLGFWTTQPPAATNQFVLLLAHRGLAEIPAAKAAYHADPEWKSTIQAWTDAQGTVTTNIVSYLLTPTSFSPLQ